MAMRKHCRKHCPGSLFPWCFPLPPDEYMAYHVSRIRSVGKKKMFFTTMFLYPIFIITFQHTFDRIVPAVLFLHTTLVVWAIERGSDAAVLYTTWFLQCSLMTVCYAKTLLHWQELLTCPLQSPGFKLAVGQLNCTGFSPAFDSPLLQNAATNYAVLRAMVSSYHVYVLLPVMFLIYAIPVPVFIVPMFVSGCIDFAIASTYVSVPDLFAPTLNPLFAGVFICIIGYRHDALMLKTWKENKQKEAWLASVAHNFGTPLTTISFAAAAMWDMTNIEDTRPMLKRQRIAVDYLRSVYSTVMYRKNGKKVVGKRQRFKIKTLQQACEDVTSTYGTSLFPDVTIVYYLEEENLPEFIVSDWAKIQQCVVNLVTNAQKVIWNGRANQSKGVSMDEVEVEVVGDGEGDGEAEGEADGDAEAAVHVGVAGAVTAGATKDTIDMLVTVRFLLDASLNQLRIEVCDSGAGVNDSLVKGYFKRSGTGLGSVGMMMESMGGAYGGYCNTTRDSGASARGCGSTFFIAVPLDDDEELDVLHHDNDHAPLTMSVEQRSEAASPVLSESKTSVAPVAPVASVASVVGVVGKGAIETTTGTTICGATTTHGQYRYKLLLVEDMVLNRNLIRLWLLHEFPDLDIADASNGKEALVQLKQATKSGHPFDIVLLDISMPIMGGFECLEEMTVFYGEQRPPTIAITTGGVYVPARKTPSATFDQWWDKTDQKALLRGMKALMLEIKQMPKVA